MNNTMGFMGKQVEHMAKWDQKSWTVQKRNLNKSLAVKQTTCENNK